MDKHLEAHILPNASLVLDYEESTFKRTSKQRDLEDKIYTLFQKGHVEALFYLGISNKDIALSASLGFWRKFAHKFIEEIRLNPDVEYLRHKLLVPIDHNFIKIVLDQLPFIQGAEYLNVDLLEDIWEALNLFFQSKIKSFNGNVEDFFHQYSPDLHFIGKIFFHLVENRDDEDFPFAFLATYASSVQNGKSKHRPLKYALSEYEDDNEKMLELLSTVNYVAKKSAIISDLLEEGEIFHPLSWSSSDAFEFLQDIDIFEEAGILCRIPNWWKKKTCRPRLSITVGSKRPSSLGMNSLVDFQANLIIDGTQLTLKEVRDLLTESEGLAYIKGKWIAVDKESLKETLSSWENAQKLMREHDITLSEALRLLISADGGRQLGVGDLDDDSLEINCGKWLKSVLEKMRDPNLIKSVTPVKEFKGNLRAYQQKGLDWLFLLHSLGFGACLADDMGLGKTIQVLAFLQILVKKWKNISANLLVLPASLLANWCSEIKKFVPSLKFIIAHPSSMAIKDLKAMDGEQIGKFDLIITTYGLVKRYDWVQIYKWNYVILDEAQAIKNPATAQTKAVKKLNSSNRLVLTGTPIENRLSDLWSLFDFLNPGLLGNRKEFSDLNKKLDEGDSDYGKLRSIIGPYILRRLKTDKSIISDLPEKIELNTYSILSKKQVALYQDLVDNLKKNLEMADGIQRRGLVLASLMRFKQICNHPDQYLGQSSYIEKESGKFIRLRELCETIFEKREKVLIFTQFKEIAGPLSQFLSTIFKRDGLILHGGTPVKKRKKLVEDFQSDEYIPYFILSVKAGGVGLNLTAANHVIHFDRWWNPAVENQATDRAFRIGQKKSVVVHKFITQGSVEEKIATMIEEKKKLAVEAIGESSEQWITEMNNEDLINLFKIESHSL